MTSRETLLAEADATERLAALVSYAPDKQRLGLAAAELRERAKTAPSDADDRPGASARDHTPAPRF
jgi:hypothetical protein